MCYCAWSESNLAASFKCLRRINTAPLKLKLMLDLIIPGLGIRPYPVAAMGKLHEHANTSPVHGHPLRYQP